MGVRQASRDIADDDRQLSKTGVILRSAPAIGERITLLRLNASTFNRRIGRFLRTARPNPGCLGV